MKNGVITEPIHFWSGSRMLIFGPMAEVFALSGTYFLFCRVVHICQAQVLCIIFLFSIMRPF